MPMAGVEPARSCLHQILSLARLPIPSHRHIQFSNLQTYFCDGIGLFKISSLFFLPHSFTFCSIHRYGQPSHRHIQFSTKPLNQKNNKNTNVFLHSILLLLLM